MCEQYKCCWIQVLLCIFVSANTAHNGCVNITGIRVCEQYICQGVWTVQVSFNPGFTVHFCFSEHDAQWVCEQYRCQSVWTIQVSFNTGVTVYCCFSEHSAQRMCERVVLHVGRTPPHHVRHRQPTASVERQHRTQHSSQLRSVQCYTPVLHTTSSNKPLLWLSLESALFDNLPVVLVSKYLVNLGIFLLVY